MLEVKFYDTVDDSLLKFAVIISQSNGKWVFCKHNERDTYEVPGGHREVGEDIYGWDFSHIHGRYEEENDLPWDYEKIARPYLRNDSI